MTEWLHYYFTIPSLWSEVNFLQNLCNITLLKLHFRNSQIRWDWLISRSNIKGWNQNEKGIELCYWLLIQVANHKLYFSSKLLFLILLLLFIEEGFPCSSVGKESACSAGNPGSDPWVGKMPRRRKWQPTPVSLPGKSHGPRMEEPGGLQSIGSQRVGHDWLTLNNLSLYGSAFQTFPCHGNQRKFPYLFGILSTASRSL